MYFTNKIRRVFLGVIEKLPSNIGEYITIAANDRSDMHLFNLQEKREVYRVIRKPPGGGLFSNVNHVVSHIAFARSFGFKVFVDFQTIENFYDVEEKLLNTKNSWESYFRQPDELGPIRFEDCLTSSSRNLNWIFDTNLEFRSIPRKMRMYQKIVNENIRLNEFCVKKVDEAKIKYFGDKANILGVFSRGTDYLADKARRQGHIKPLEVNAMAYKAREVFDEQHFEYVFLSCESEEQVKVFQDEFGSRLLVIDRPRVSNYDSEVYAPKMSHGRKNDSFHTGLEYLIEVYLLASCAGFCGDITNGSLFSLALNNNQYRYCKLGYN